MKLPVAITLIACSCSVLAQGTFQNLDFEQANPVSAGAPNAPYLVTTESALPYWTVTIGGVQQASVSYNVPSAGTPAVMLAGPGYSPGFAPIDGNYGVMLTGSFPTAFPSISQTGLIPDSAQSLLFDATQPDLGVVGQQLQVMIGSQVVPFAVVGTGSDYTLYGANISAWAGQTEQLTFSALQSTSGLNNWEIDDISFSTTAVPEPSPLILTAAGGLLFTLYRRFAPTRK